MLVLSRKLNQSIHLGQNITVSIVRIKGNVVQLGIEAPKEIHVLRSELIERDAQFASQTSGLAAAESEAASAGHHAAEDQPTTNEKDQSELIAALRIISQTETVNSKPLPPLLAHHRSCIGGSMTGWLLGETPFENHFPRS